MNLNHLRWALEVERTGSFTAAANNLFIAQSNLSSAIKALEQSLGFPIFFRSNRGATVTPDGARFLQEARQAMYHLGNLENALERRVFSIAVHRHCTFVGDATANLLRHIPQKCSLGVHEGREEDILDAVYAGSVLFGVLMHPEEGDASLLERLAARGLTLDTFLTCGMYALVSNSHPLAGKTSLTAQDVAAYPAIAFLENESRLSSFEVQRSAVGVPQEMNRLGVADRATLYQMLQTSHGMFWTALVNKRDLERYQLALLPWGNYIRRFSFVRPRSGVMPALAQTWMEEIRACAQSLLL